MISFSFLSVILVALSGSLVQAAPWVPHTVHRVGNIGRSFKVIPFYPKSTYKTFGGKGVSSPISNTPGNSSPSIEDSAIEFVRSQLEIDASQVLYQSGFSPAESDEAYAYVKQAHMGLPISNAVANIAWKDGHIVAFGSSFVKLEEIDDPTPTIDVPSIIGDIEEQLEGKFNGHPATLEYIVLEDGSVSLAHVIQIQNEDTGTWYEAFASAHNGQLLSITDFVAHASYTVLPINKETFPEGQVTLIDPQDEKASPMGWHSIGLIKTKVTSGNNVKAYAGPNLFTEQTSKGLNFNVKYDDNQDPTVKSNAQAATINAFYIANTIHDVTYRYGFTENAFNFQFNNMGRRGQAFDGVLMSVQDASGLNNANFATPPDGQPGICRMYIWDYSKPRRDGAVENDIIVHEMTHGVTNRMTGGGSGRCLQTTESGGMGEGWSDAMANWVNQKSSNVADFIMGQYVTNSTKGIRSYPYSTDPKVNPLRYSSISTRKEVHAIGEVWANILHNVYAALVKAHGFSKEALTNPDTKEGNVTFMHLFIDALLLQPCNPTFIQARDAWIQADQNRYKGANKCILYRAFASRGLGLNAKNYIDNTDLPTDCIRDTGIQQQQPMGL